MRVLITDGNERAALAAARSLVAARYEVFVSAPSDLSLAGVSRGVKACTVPIDPLAEPQAYVAALAQLVERLVIDILLPITDPSVEAVLEYRAVFEDRVFLPLPSLEAYRHASDKALSLELARRAGLAVPETVIVKGPDWRDTPDPKFFPAVIKPHRSVVPAGQGNGGKRKTGVRYVANVDACRAALSTLPDGAFPVLVQQQVHGPGEGLFLLRWNGRPVAAFAHRRLREKPPEGGVSVYRESIAPPAALLAAGTRLLEVLNWQGVAMIECKRDLATGRYVFMEVNGRLWGSLQLAIDAGVDFPGLLMACALGATVLPTHGYRVGVRSRWFWGDVDNLYLRLRNGGGTRGKLTAVREFLRIHRGRDREEIWRWRDPAPFLLESLRRLSLRS
jgi:predicted ATP-grasp superfamily ATP-dependent carboligase